LQRDGAVVRIHPVALIGEGPHGEVFVGNDEVLRRRVVVKKIATRSLSHASRARMIDEARALSRLAHPHILHIYSCTEEDGNDVYTFEHVEGVRLSETLDEKRDFAKKVKIATAVASALAEAHRHGIVHGALSAESVLIAQNGEVKLADFASTSTTIGVEDLTRAVTRGDDMYAFGLLLREFLGEGDRDVRALVASLLSDASSERTTAVTALARLERLASRRGRRIRMAAIAVVIALFVVGAAKYMVDLQRERREAIVALAEAETRRARANDLLSFMIRDIRSKLTYAGRLDIMDSTSEKVLSYFETVRPEEVSASEATLNVEALVQIANAQSARARYGEARAILVRAIELSDKTLARFPDNAPLRFAAASAHGVLSPALDRGGDMDGAIRYGRMYAKMMGELVERDPENADYVRNLGSAHSNLGSLYDRREEIAASLAEIERAVAAKRRAVALEDNAANRFDLGVPVHKAGMALFKLGRFNESLRTLDAGRAELDALLASNSTQWRLRELITVFDYDLVTVTLATGDLDAAARHAAAHLDAARQLTAFDAENMDWTRSLVIAHRSNGTIARMKGNTAAAVGHHAAAVELLSAVFARGVQPRVLQSEMVGSRIELTWSLLAAGKSIAALTQANVALDALGSLRGEKAAERLLGEALLAQGAAREARGDREGAAKSWEEALRVLVPLDQLSPDPRIADAHARVLLRLGRTDAAQPLIEQLAAIGYRNREFEALHRSKGMFLGSL